jgi:hypothetical protein
MQLVLRLSGYLIEDGELDEIEIGSTFTYPLEVSFRDKPQESRDEPARVRLDATSYFVVGRIAAARGAVLVIDLGDLLVYVNDWDVPTTEVGACLYGAACIALADLHTLDPFKASEMATAATYTWRVLGIELDVTPWINPNTYWERDESRFETRTEESTRQSAVSGKMNAFFCLCERVDSSKG